MIEVRRADDGAIEFFRDDERYCFYDITVDNQFMGFGTWLDHLNQKNWFTEQVMEDFITVWNNR